VLAEDLLHLAAQVVGLGETGGEAVDGSLRGLDQALDLGRAFRVFTSLSARRFSTSFRR
jgi:hypothetical protein